MTDDNRLEQLLRQTLRDTAPTHAPATLRLTALTATSTARQRPRWIAALAARPMTLAGTVAAGAPGVRLAALVVVLAVLLATVAAGAGAFLARQQTSLVPQPIPSAAEATPLAPQPTPSAVATTVPFFSMSGSLAVARSRHTATLLLDGRVLIVGGNPGDAADPNKSLNSAEIWDPATGQFTPTGSLWAPREAATATLLADGRVLVVGGRNKYDTSSTAEVWDPATGEFAPAGTMGSPRMGHTATRLADGDVLVTGGASDHTGNVLTTSAERWNPQTNMFTPTGSMADAREGQVATLLHDGRVLVIGGVGMEPRGSGSGYHFPRASSAEIWDPATDKFTPTGSLAAAQMCLTATPLQDGTVLVIGNPTTTEQSAATEVWSALTKSFTAGAPLAGTMSCPTATLLPDGRVLVLGGDLAASAEVLNPGTGFFSRIGDAVIPQRSGATATLLADGRVLVVGGVDSGGLIAAAEIVSP